LTFLKEKKLLFSRVFQTVGGGHGFSAKKETGF
jgi:hypothetical protein